MRHLKIEELEAMRDADGELPDRVGGADWKDSVDTVLDVVDGLLEAFGLEVVQYSTGADDYAFTIEKRTQ